MSAWTKKYSCKSQFTNELIIHEILRGCPHVVKLLSVDRERHTVTLERFDSDLTKAQFNVVETEHVVREIITGLAEIHARGVIHADIKRGNILVKRVGASGASGASGALPAGSTGDAGDADGAAAPPGVNDMIDAAQIRVAICDFDMSLVDTHTGVHGMWMCTCTSRAPELFGDYRATVFARYHTEIDMWSLGCVLYDLMAQHPRVVVDSEHTVEEHIYALFGSCEIPSGVVAVETIRSRLATPFMQYAPVLAACLRANPHERDDVWQLATRYRDIIGDVELPAPPIRASPRRLRIRYESWVEMATHFTLADPTGDMNPDILTDETYPEAMLDYFLVAEYINGTFNVPHDVAYAFALACLGPPSGTRVDLIHECMRVLARARQNRIPLNPFVIGTTPLSARTETRGRPAKKETRVRGNSC